MATETKTPVKNSKPAKGKDIAIAVGRQTMTAKKAKDLGLDPKPFGKAK